MKGTKKTQMQTPRPQIRTMKSMPIDRAHHELLIRRSTNHNVHVITPHGKVQLGRKGRSE
jgi:hypothetical protein